MAAPQRPKHVVTNASLKARQAVMFEEDAAREVQATEVVEWKSFREYLQTTPADPFSPATKAMLAAAALAVALLFGAAVWKMTQKRNSRPTATAYHLHTHPRFAENGSRLIHFLGNDRGPIAWCPLNESSPRRQGSRAHGFAPHLILRTNLGTLMIPYGNS